MNQVTFASYIREKTKTNATTFPDAKIITYANVIKDDIVKEILKANEDYFVMDLTRNLEAGKRKYSFPSDILSQMKYIEAQLDGVNWSELEETDINTLKISTDENSIQAYMQGKKPLVDIEGNAITVLSDSSIIDVTNGLKLKAAIYPADLTVLSGTADMSVPPSNISFGVPRQLHKVWATMVIVEYKGSKEKPLPLTEAEKNVGNDLLLAINSLKGQNLNRVTVATMPTYNNGQDY